MTRLKLRYILLLLLIAYTLSGIAQVRPEERAVVRRFGAVVAHPGPGLWVGLPWGMDTVDRVLVRVVRQVTAGWDASALGESAPAGQLLTGDENLVNVQLLVDYAIGETDADLDRFVAHRDRVDAAVSREAEAAAAEWTGSRGVDDVLLTGSAELPAWLMNELPKRVEALQLGIRIQRVSVGLAPPEEVRASFESVTQAQTGIRTKEYQARQEADQRLRQAEEVRYRLEREADTFRRGIERQSRAEADDFLVQRAAYRDLHRTNPDALALIWWSETRKILQGMKARGGRVEMLDATIGSSGLDVTQFLTPKRK